MLAFPPDTSSYANEHHFTNMHPIWQEIHNTTTVMLFSEQNISGKGVPYIGLLPN